MMGSNLLPLEVTAPTPHLNFSRLPEMLIPDFFTEDLVGVLIPQMGVSSNQAADLSWSRPVPLAPGPPQTHGMEFSPPA